MAPLPLTRLGSGCPGLLQASFNRLALTHQATRNHGRRECVPSSSSSTLSTRPRPPLTLAPALLAALIKLAETRVLISDTKLLKKLVHSFHALLDHSAQGDKLFVSSTLPLCRCAPQTRP